MVQSKVSQCFPNRNQSEVMSLLDTIGYWFERNKGSMPEALRAQTQLAILKLCEGRFSQLRDYVERAKRDYRDVIVPAESPSLSRLGAVAYERLPLAEFQQTLEDELLQYTAWLNGQEEADTKR